GDADSSLLVQALRYENFEMPPKGKLPPQVIADFENWIKGGAADPRGGSGALAIAPPAAIDFQAARQFWSLQPPMPHSLPAGSDLTWPQQRIDSFIRQRLDGAGLKPSAEASRGMWLRRVTLDLIGLPPTVEDQQALESDQS